MGTIKEQESLMPQALMHLEARSEVSYEQQGV